jgi:N-acetylglucosaminyldiphosphoundecaprenol N-acetyl-beta-D-mannosaminyltransferase
VGSEQVRLGGVVLPRHHVAGLAVVSADVESALEWLWADAADHAARVYALVNAYSATLRRQNAAYAALLDEDGVVPLPDGAALSFGARIVRIGQLGRCPGPDLFEAAAERASGDATRFFLLGGGPGVVERLQTALVARHPGLQVAGVATPPYGEWGDAVSEGLCSEIRRVDPDIVWLGVSAPKQEVWATRYAEQIGAPIVCVGAAFDFLSGVKHRAPRWVNSIGMEWLFRLLSEPRRLWKRYLVGNAVFVWDLARFRGSAGGEHGGLKQ